MAAIDMPPTSQPSPFSDEAYRILFAGPRYGDVTLT
jgi:hypothetical protein